MPDRHPRAGCRQRRAIGVPGFVFLPGQGFAADRRAQLVATLEQENTRLRDALTEAEHLAAQQCKHPAAAVDGGHCHACGTDVW